MGAPIEPGTILADKYQVDEVLGEGGMGIVVAATDVQLERRVAIKFLLPEYAQHHEAGQRFMREARAAVKIQSEHIARVIDVNRMDNGSPYIVMEYLQGGDLSHVLSRRGPLPIDEATSFVLQACEAIAEAHSQGIVHRDLKPANLFLARQPDGTAKIKVLDFGISKMTLQGAPSTDPSLTRTSSMMGSPLYMSPEQMRSTRNVDARADIWALGVILYELLSAQRPFTGDSIPTLSASILLEEPESLRALRPDVPLRLEQAIVRCLRKDPAQRFPTVSELALALLPFAPRRAQHNVERITKLLRSAGLSSSEYNGSVHPPSEATLLDANSLSEPNTVPLPSTEPEPSAALASSAVPQPSTEPEPGALLESRTVSEPSAVSDPSAALEPSAVPKPNLALDPSATHEPNTLRAATSGNVARVVHVNFAPSVVHAGDAASRHDRTQANFGRTGGLGKRSSALGWAAAGVVALVAVGGGLLFLSKRSPEASTPAIARESAPSPAAGRPRAKPAARESEAVTARAPTAEPVLEAPEVAAASPSASAPSAPIAEPAPKAVAVTKTPAPSKASTSASKTPARPTTTAAVQAPAPTSDGGFRSRFGSRK